MPQLQLPMFPAGVTEINHQIAVEKKAETIYYVHGHLPVFRHAEEDVRAFRMITSQMIVNGTVKRKEIVRAFGVPMVTVKRYVKLMRERGTAGFYGETAAQLRVRAQRGSAGASEVWMIIVVSFLFGLYFKPRMEERLLAKAFPAYSQYKRRTKALIPFVW